MAANRPEGVRRKRRIEVGFFVRKIVNDVVVYYRQIPGGSSTPPHALEGPQEPAPAPPAPPPPPAGSTESTTMARSSTSTGTGGEGTTAQLGTGGGTGDSGPVGGSARFEFGIFFSSETETETTDDDGKH